jgi:hypothetical protein
MKLLVIQKKCLKNMLKEKYVPVALAKRVFSPLSDPSECELTGPSQGCKEEHQMPPVSPAAVTLLRD